MSGGKICQFVGVDKDEEASYIALHYRVTHQVGPNLPLTSEQKLCFSVSSSYKNATFVFKSTIGLVLPDVSPCSLFGPPRKRSGRKLEGGLLVKPEFPSQVQLTELGMGRINVIPLAIARVSSLDSGS